MQQAIVSHGLHPAARMTILLVYLNSGYSPEELALKWVKHFDRYTSKRQIGEYRLLLFDGHDSIASYDFISYCDAKKIIPLCFPENTSDFLQPLDRIIFKPGQHLAWSSVR